MKKISEIEYRLEGLKLAYKNLESQMRIVKECEEVLEEAIKNEKEE